MEFDSPHCHNIKKGEEIKTPSFLSEKILLLVSDPCRINLDKTVKYYKI